MEERDLWFAKATRVTASYGGESRHSRGEGDRLGDLIAGLYELDKMINSRIDTLVDLRLELESVMEQMEDSLLKNILALRYINGLTFEKIAERLFYSYRQIRNLHDKALELLPLYAENEVMVLAMSSV
jgi:DNA-directed RNA polymerase specialized sigma subunit